MLTCGIVFKLETTFCLAQLPKSFLLKRGRGVLKGVEGFQRGRGGAHSRVGWCGVGLGFHFTNF